MRRYSEEPVLAAEPEARQWGIGGDNNAYPGMHEDSARACAACAAAAGAVAQGRARAALVPAAGAHHGTASQAQGFGIYNETAIAVRALLEAGLERVAYVDLDVHHGNGTQWIFYDEPRVLTVSVHESGRHLFPGSGFPAETGGAGAPGSAANVALPPFAGDAAYRAAWDRVVAPVVRAFGPDAIVAQCGVDHHHADPLSHMLTTMPLYRELWARLRALAEEVCGGGWSRSAAGATSPAPRRRAPGRAWPPSSRAGPSTATSPSPGAGSPSRRAVPSRPAAGGRTRGRRPTRSATGARPPSPRRPSPRASPSSAAFGESARDRAPGG